MTFVFSLCLCDFVFIFLIQFWIYVYNSLDCRFKIARKQRQKCMRIIDWLEYVAIERIKIEIVILRMNSCGNAFFVCFANDKTDSINLSVVLGQIEKLFSLLFS